MGLSQFRHPGENDVVDEADPEPRDDSSADEHVGVDRATLQGGSQKGEKSANESSLLPSELVTKPSTNKSPKNCSEVIYCSKTALLCGLGNGAAVTDVGHGDEAGRT